MIRLVNRETGEALGTIRETDLEIMRRVFEEESGEDTDYYIAEDSLELLTQQGLSAEAVALLQKNLNKDGAVDLGWEHIVERPTNEIYGRLLWIPSERPAVGMKVEVRQQGALRDILLGWVFSKRNGDFQLTFSSEESSGSEL